MKRKEVALEPANEDDADEPAERNVPEKKKKRKLGGGLLKGGKEFKWAVVEVRPLFLACHLPNLVHRLTRSFFAVVFLAIFAGRGWYSDHAESRQAVCGCAQGWFEGQELGRTVVMDPLVCSVDRVASLPFESRGPNLFSLGLVQAASLTFFVFDVSSCLSFQRLTIDDRVRRIKEGRRELEDEKGWATWSGEAREK